MLLALATGSIALAMAPRISLGGASLADAIDGAVPGFDQIRAVFRAVVLAQLAIVALAMLGARTIQAWARRRARWRWVLHAACILAVIELVPERPHVTRLPDDDTAWIAWMRDVAPPRAAMAWIPFAPSGEVCDHEDIAAAMLGTLVHGHPMVNGYSSYFPAVHNHLAKTTKTLPDRRSVMALWVAGVRHVVTPDDGPLRGLDEAGRERLGLRIAMHDDRAAVTVFELRQAPAPDE
jgi:hypothetical protein